MSLWDDTSHISSNFICSVLYRTVSYHVFSNLTFSYQNPSTISCISISYQSTILCLMHFLSDISLQFCISIRMLLELNNVCCAVLLKYLSKDYSGNIYRYPQLSISIKKVQQKAFAPFHFHPWRAVHWENLLHLLIFKKLANAYIVLQRIYF